MLHSVLETRTFSQIAKRHLTSSEIDNLILSLAADPQDAVHLGRGLWKKRVARRGGGKSGGYRVVYYYAEPGFPVILLTMYAKSDKGNLSTSELSALSSAVEELRGPGRRKH